MTKGLAQTNGGGGLALTEGGRVDTSHDHVVSIGNVLEALTDIKADLSLVASVGLQLLRENTSIGGDLSDVDRSDRLRHLLKPKRPDTVT